jgi:hypothetical protein
MSIRSDGTRSRFVPSSVIAKTLTYSLTYVAVTKCAATKIVCSKTGPLSVALEQAIENKGVLYRLSLIRRFGLGLPLHLFNDLQTRAYLNSVSSRACFRPAIVEAVAELIGDDRLPPTSVLSYRRPAIVLGQRRHVLRRKRLGAMAALVPPVGYRHPCKHFRRMKKSRRAPMSFGYHAGFTQ